MRRYLDVFKYTRRAAELVWSTNPALLVAMAALTLVLGVLPGAMAWVGKLIIDAVVDQSSEWTLRWIGLEAGLVVVMAAGQRSLDVLQQLLRAQLGHRVNVMILEKALSLDLVHFEDSEFYDKMTRARREASRRPLALVNKSFGVVQNSISLATYGVLLWQFSPWAFLILAVAAVPAFVAETKFAGEAFRLFRWQSPETRKQFYLETVLAREDYAKEVKLLQLGDELLGRYRGRFEALYSDDRDLTLRRGGWGFLLGLLSTGALYAAYAWIAATAVARTITLGQMTMYLLVFKQGQAAFSAILKAIGGMYEDNLYLSNLYEFLNQEVLHGDGEHAAGPAPGDGIRFQDVSFTYPGADQPALRNLTLHVPPGRKLALVGQNGSGKTTLIKLLTRLYVPDSGVITLDGLPLQDWGLDALRRRIGVIFQDFVRYQFTVGENIGVGDVEHLGDRERVMWAADKGMAKPFIDTFEKGLETQLGRWFKDGRELSIGQWQKVALSRAFMSKRADILVLDEPTAAMDAEAEAEIFQRFDDMTENQMAILISHRFSTVRMADQIAVLDEGRVVEHGDHASLMEQGGLYARLFTIQAEGYR